MIKINRRETLCLLGMAAITPASGQSAAPLKLKGRIKQSCVRGILGKMTIDEFCRTLNSLGIVGVDLVGQSDWPAIKDHGLSATMVPGAGTIKDGLNNRGKRDQWLGDFRRNIEAAAKFGWKRVITMSGDRAGISDEEGLANCAEVLKEAVKIAADNNVTICMELLNSKVNHPGYMCDHTVWGVELCKRVASPNFKLLYDIYHMQIMEGDIIRTISDNIQFIDHFHTAGNPGRRDLDEEQELFYPAIMRTIAKLTEAGKFSGYVAHEFSPKQGLESLREAVQLCDV